MSLTPEQRKLARHALGLDNPNAKGRSYRNRYVTAVQFHPDWEAMMGDGFAERFGDTYYLTKAGALLALDPGESVDPEDFQ